MQNESAAPITAFIGIGSNLDSPEDRVKGAAGLLAEIPSTRVDRVSSLYQSAPFGVTNQPDFVNAVACLSTSLEVRVLFRKLQKIEEAQGRVRTKRWGPRVLDLDLLVYGAAVVSDPDLTVPHPGIADRNFVLLPLQEIAPDLEIPGLGRIADLAADSKEPRIARLE
jgi:2-amino-4-hydroxy-6-hydroxymethyldihydropteridine diphosphokinase